MLLRFDFFYSEQDHFKKALALSGLFHAVLISIFLIKLAFFNKPAIDLSEAISVNIGELYTSDKLPEKASLPPAAENNTSMPQETVPVETVKTPAPTKMNEKIKPAKDEVNLLKSKTKQKQALEKIKKISAIEKIKQDLNDEKANTENKAKSKKVYKSRVLSAGTALTGLDKIEAADYLQLLDSNIKQAWSLPQWLSKKNLRSQILVKFNVSGQIIDTKLLLSSGNQSYDNYCLQAVNRAAPFPKVPEKFSEKFSIDGLIVGFPE